MKLRNGDYIPDGAGGFQCLRGRQAILEDALFLLSARRGGFAPMPELGSRLYLLAREKSGARESMARVYVREALEPLGIEVMGITLTEGEVLHLQIELQAGGQTDVLEVDIA